MGPGRRRKGPASRESATSAGPLEEHAAQRRLRRIPTADRPRSLRRRRGANSASAACAMAREKKRPGPSWLPGVGGSKADDLLRRGGAEAAGAAGVAGQVGHREVVEVLQS